MLGGKRRDKWHVIPIIILALVFWVVGTLIACMVGRGLRKKDHASISPPAAISLQPHGRETFSLSTYGCSSMRFAMWLTLPRPS